MDESKSSAPQDQDGAETASDTTPSAAPVEEQHEAAGEADEESAERGVAAAHGRTHRRNQTSEPEGLGEGKGS
jgi:hypothetical protein